MTINLLVDEDVDGALTQALSSKFPERIVRVQDVGLRSVPDETILQWAAAQGRVILSGDRSTFPAHVIRRIQAGLPMAGAMILRHRFEHARVLEDISLILLYDEMAAWANRIEYVPFES